jgi:glycine betaine/proline transport system substrate-binding protein
VESGSVVNMMASKAIKTYHLAPMELVSSSTAAMTVQLKRAIARKDWIVVTGWQPLWIWADFKLHFLDDPEGVFGGVGHMDTVINPQLQRRAPQVVDWLRTFRLPQAELASMLLQLSNGQSVEQIVEQWLARQPESWAA